MKRLLVCLLLSSPVYQLFAQTSYYIATSDNVKLHINEYGSGKPVILLSGGPGINADYLNPIWKNLSNVQFIVPDQRGTGKSSLKTYDANTISVSKYVQDLEALRIHLKLGRITLMGHSWGSMLALAYAAKYPANVEKLILIAPGGITTKFFAYFNDNIQMRLCPEDLAEAKIIDTTGVTEDKATYPGFFF